MTLATSRTRPASLTMAGAGTTFRHAQPPGIPGALRRAAATIGDLLGVMGVILFIPFVILAIATPIALCVGLLRWILGLL